MGINIKLLTEADDINLYRLMTFPRFYENLDNFKPDGPIIALKVIDSNKQPQGLGLAYSVPDEKGQILSVFIDVNSQNKGIGTLLLHKLEQELFNRNHSCIKTFYATDSSNTNSFERILKKQNWTTPVVEKVICKADHRILQAPWIRYPLSPEFSVFPWINLSNKERSMLLQKQEIEEWYPEILSPFQNESFMEPLNSIGLRHKREIVGWCITHRVALNTIRYSYLFVKEKFQSSGLGILLMAESIRRHAKAAEKDKDLADIHGIWMVEKNNALMMNFLERNLLPWSSSINELKYSYKYKPSEKDRR